MNIDEYVQRMHDLRKQKQVTDQDTETLDGSARIAQQLNDMFFAVEACIEDMHTQLKSQSKQRGSDPKLVSCVHDLRKPINRLRKTIRSIAKIYATQIKAIESGDFKKYPDHVVHEQHMYKKLRSHKPVLEQFSEYITKSEEALDALISGLLLVCLTVLGEEVSEDVQEVYTRCLQVASFKEDTQKFLED
jgi:hypothetical protein